MASFNKVILLGNLTRDPEVRVTPGGLTICKFGMALNRRFRTQAGEDRDETTFVDLDAFGKQAETLSKYTRRGSLLHVEGRLKLDQWESNGEKRSKLSVVLENYQLLPRGTESSGGGGGGSRNYEDVSPPSRSSGPSQNTRTSQPVEDIEDDVPF